MADNAELLQRIELLESLITAGYTPPEGPEYSFPVTGQGVTLDQYRQMMRGIGAGVLMGREYPYTLVGHDTDSETNSRNTLILRVDLALGKAEAVIDGFYHRLTEDMDLSFPPVTVSTTYHVCLTLDPAKADDPSGPISVQVYAGEPPTTGGRKHIILATVRREPSQLLTDATRTTHRPYVAPVVSARYAAGLPASDEVLFGTLGVTRTAAGGGTGEIYQSRGEHGWDNLLVGEWKSFGPDTGNEWSGEGGAARRRVGGVDVWFNINRGNQSGSPTAPMFNLPEEFAVAQNFYATVWTTNGPQGLTVSSEGQGRNGALAQATARPPYTRGHFFIPDYFLRTP